MKKLSLSNGDQLQFMDELNTKTYIKIKRGIQNIEIKGKQGGKVSLPQAIDIFEDVCIAIRDKEGKNKDINMEYIEGLKVADYMKIEKLVEPFLVIG